MGGQPALLIADTSWLVSRRRSAASLGGSLAFSRLMALLVLYQLALHRHCVVACGGSQHQLRGNQSPHRGHVVAHSPGRAVSKQLNAGDPGRALEANRAQPLLVTMVPRPLAGIREPAPQEQFEQPVPTASAVLDGVLATATQIARRFLFLRRRLHLRKQPSAKELGELLRVAPVRLDVIAWLHRRDSATSSIASAARRRSLARLGRLGRIRSPKG